MTPKEILENAIYVPGHADAHGATRAVFVDRRTGRNWLQLKETVQELVSSTIPLRVVSRLNVVLWRYNDHWIMPIMQWHGADHSDAHLVRAALTVAFPHYIPGPDVRMP